MLYSGLFGAKSKSENQRSHNERQQSTFGVHKVIKFNYCMETIRNTLKVVD